jgi:ribonuclease E
MQPSQAAQSQPQAHDADTAGDTEARRPRYATGFVSDDEAVAPQHQQVAEPVQMPARAPVQAPATAATPVSQELPKVRSFELPLAQLNEVAQGSGLQWVNSDASKIAAVQAAIAAEPQPVRVQRERPAPVVIEEAPLVLVETKRDLREMQLPFEKTEGQPPQS